MHDHKQIPVYSSCIHARIDDWGICVFTVRNQLINSNLSQIKLCLLAGTLLVTGATGGLRLLAIKSAHPDGVGMLAFVCSIQTDC